jgi:hypothetical protein
LDCFGGKGDLRSFEEVSQCAVRRTKNSSEVVLIDDNHHKTTGFGTTLPPISRLFETRDSCHRPSLSRVENVGRVTPSQETVNLGFLGRVENPTIDDTP